VDDYVFGFSVANEFSKRRDIFPELSASLSALNKDPSAVLTNIAMVIEEEQSTVVLNNLPRVDYDDTGFVPRPQLEADLKRKILGRHPLVTVLGDGGNGKTALILQTAYRLVFSQDHNFDAIIWVSAKGSELTTKEIRTISDAITSSIEIFEKVAEFEPSNDDPIGRVRRLLSENKALLIIDNLETVLNQRILTFAEDIPGESKLVFTSRVPLGGDLSVRVDAFTEVEAERYLRRLIDAYGIKSLMRLSTGALQKFVRSLNYKPLLIKWFALGVLSGLTPESITRNPEIALRFCLENVIDTLSDEAKKVALAFALALGSHSAIIIQFLLDLSARDVESGLATLLRYGLIDDDSTNTQDRTYTMSVFVRSYLTRIEKVLPSLVENVKVRSERIQGLFERRRVETNANRYIMGHYTVRSRSEAIAVTHLAQAFYFSEKGETDKALKLLMTCA
jgi:LuxR family transcriptional regulator, glucitol operon activator